uniref:Galectin n=1 Tax=Parascaris equorum TaxID=6256 RepID=A0A914RVY6_PAREQ
LRFAGRADHQIVLNSLVNNRWGVEERYGNVFKEGRAFSLRILVLSEYFKIAVDGRHLCDYLYRIGINDVQSIFISGNISVDVIEFQGELFCTLHGLLSARYRSTNCSYLIILLLALKGGFLIHPRYMAKRRETSL